MRLLKIAGIMIALALGQVLGVPAAAFAQDKDAKAPGGLPRKDAAKKGTASPAPKAPPPGMEMRPAPKAGSMPGKNAPTPKGRLGTEPSRTEKLGTPPPQGSKDKPPRPQ